MKLPILKLFVEASTRAKCRVIFASLFGVVVIAGAGWLINTILSAQARLAAEKAAALARAEALKPKPIAPTFAYKYEVKAISIPLVNRSASRVAYAQFNLILDCPSEEAKKTMVMNRAKILDSIFEVASDFYVEDFEDPKGIDSFKTALVTMFKGRFPDHSPRTMAINNWFLN